MTQLVPSCILSVTSFTSPAATLPGLARLERKLLPSQTFFYLISAIAESGLLWATLGQQYMMEVVREECSPLSCANRCCCAGHGTLLKAWNLRPVSCAEMPRSVTDTVCVAVLSATHLCTHRSASSLHFYFSWKELI